MTLKDPRILKIHSVDDMKTILLAHGRPLDSFKQGDEITVWNKMEKNYSYRLSEAPGTNMAFKPYITPGEMLATGVFEGKYLNVCLLEFPAVWYWNAIQMGTLSPGGRNVDINLFKTDSRQPLGVWQKNGWVPSRAHKPHKSGHYPELSDAKTNPDERGWFQWFCRYWMGRRIPELDHIQIQRWRSFLRHAGQIKANCSPGVISCRPRQRQGLLQWAHNPFI